MRIRPLLCLGIAAAFVLGTAGAASAHVKVHADDTTPGDYAKLTFRVPTERDDASTTKLSVTIPEQTVLASVSAQPHPGWSVAIKTARLPKPVKTEDSQVSTVVREVTWTAQSAGVAIKPGEFDEFALSVGPLPHVSSMTFPAVQTYSNGEVVRWIETAAPGAAEPEHPAPSLELTGPNTQTAAASRSIPVQGKSSSGTATAALVLAIVAVVIAVGTAGIVVVRRRG